MLSFSSTFIKSFRYTSSNHLSNYQQLFNKSINKPDEFWAEAANNITWNKKWDKVLNFDLNKSPTAKWYPGGETNMCYNALDRHAEKTPNKIAFITDSTITGEKQSHTFKELLVKVSRLAKVYQNHGVKKGDTVIIYMPMIIELPIAMLACSRIGAIHSVVFGGFASKELATRIEHVNAKLLVTASGSKEGDKLIDYLEIVEKVGNKLPQSIICYDRPNIGQKSLETKIPNIYSWTNEMDKAPTDHADIIWVESNHPLYVLYTSGTTGIPKGVVRPTAGHIVTCQWSFPNVWGMTDSSRNWFCAADIGWVVGHTLTVYSPMLCGTPSILYEGKPVSTKTFHAPFFRLLSEYNVQGAFVSPTACRAIRNFASSQDDRNCTKIREKYPIKNFENLFIAGEHCEVDTLRWSREAFQCNSYDNWWQTEVGWPVVAPLVGINDKFAISQPDGTVGLPIPGWNVHEINDEIQVKLPMPPGSLDTLWKAEDRYCKFYFSKNPGFYDSMDSGSIDKNGFVKIMNRTDDVFNVAGHRLSSGAMEEALMDERGLMEAAVVGKNDDLKGQIPVAFLVADNDKIVEKALKRVETQIGRFAKIQFAYRVKRLPKTRSGKTPRKTLKALVDNTEIKIPSTIEDASVYDELKKVVLA